VYGLAQEGEGRAAEAGDCCVPVELALPYALRHAFSHGILLPLGRNLPFPQSVKDEPLAAGQSSCSPTPIAPSRHQAPSTCGAARLR